MEGKPFSNEKSSRIIFKRHSNDSQIITLDLLMDEEHPQIKVNHGLNMAWDALLALEPTAVCKNALAEFDPHSSTYSIKCFGYEFRADKINRTLTCEDDGGGIFSGKFMEYLRLALLMYLTSAKDIPATGRLTKPGDVKGGHIHVQGTHKLPLGDLADAYGSNARGFLDRGRLYGAEPVEGIGDAAICLHPLPRVPVTMMLRVEDPDEGFPPEVRIFFDSTLDFQVAPDVGWSLAMVCCMTMMSESSP